MALIGNVKEKWEEIKLETISKFTEIKDIVVQRITETKKDTISKLNELKINAINLFNDTKNKTIGIWEKIKTSIIEKTVEVKNSIKNQFKEAYNGITNTFSNIGSFFNNVWRNVRYTFSNLGINIGNAIGFSVRSGINGVISLIQNTMNRAIEIINGAIGVINKMPGVNVGTVPRLYLPRLDKGNVAYDETLAVFGEYSGARSNPEITAPQSIIYDTMKKALLDANGGTNGTINFENTIKLNSKVLARELIEDLDTEAKRRGYKALLQRG